jgi:DNA (cytosine-5)-methyltransferase 1
VADLETYPSTFFDLFAGIGGFRLGFEQAGATCVFSAEYDKYAQQTYAENFEPVAAGDITGIRTKDIPDHDILVAGFPCQPFSSSGVSKKRSMDKPVAFEDKTQGTLFFEIARILKAKKPTAFLLENVKNLKSHYQGATYHTIIDTLINDLGYYVYDEIYDASLVVPQHRERIFLVGFDRSDPRFFFPHIPKRDVCLRDVLEDSVDPKYTLSDRLWTALQAHASRHADKGHGFGYTLADLDGISRTLKARYHKDGQEILIPQEGQNPRRLTPRECCRLMGFPWDFKIPVSDTQAYRQFGNAVVPTIVEPIARGMLEYLQN